MATADDYLFAIERCRSQAETTTMVELKQMWLLLAESYQLLVIADDIQADGPLIQSPGARSVPFSKS